MPASAPAGSSPGPGPEVIPNPAAEFSKLHLLQLEISWDFGDQASDWRKELTEDDPTARFLLRWKHSGPSFEAATLTVYDAGDQLYSGGLPLSLDPPDVEGWRYESYLVGDLPGPPTLTMRIRLENTAGNQAGSASPEVQISAPTPDDPFLFTPLYTWGVVTDTGVPGLAGGISCGAEEDVEERRFLSGVRRFGGGAGEVGPGDRWHWGSITKSMTATLMGLLIEDGTPLPNRAGPVNWDTRISSVWPEWRAEMRPRFVDTTLRHLACHRSGITLNNDEWDLANNDLWDPRQLRSSIVRSVVNRQQTDPETGLPTLVGVDFAYRNENYFILGAVIERLVDARFEDLMQSRLFGPLGMTSVGWGVPPDISIYQPHGHYREFEYPHKIVVLNLDLREAQAPAGALYCSVEDMLKYLRLHLFGSEGLLTVQPETLTELHTPYPIQFRDDVIYAWGWGTSLDGSQLGHDGSIGTYHARVTVDANTGIVCATATNMGFRPEGTRSSAGYGDDAVNLLHAHLVEKATAKCAGTLVIGTIGAGTGGSPGIRAGVEPAPSTSQDHLTGPEAPSLGGSYFPASLYLSDFVHQRKVAAARAPRITSLVRSSATGLLHLRFRSEAGAIYQLWGFPDLLPENRRLLSEVEAVDESTEFELPISSDISEYYYQVGDLLP